MTFHSLAPLIDRGALYALFGQEQLSQVTEELGPNRWEVDMNVGTLTFTSSTDPNKKLVAFAELIATLAPGPRSMLWGWAHPQGSTTGALREYGQQNEIDILTQTEVPFPEDAPAGGEGLQQWLSARAHDVGIAAVEITGRRPYYAVPLDHGTWAVYLLNIPLPDQTLSDALIQLPRLLASGFARDPRTAVWALAIHTGWNFQWDDDTFGSATLSDENARAIFTFSENGQVTELDVTHNPTAS